MLRRLPPTIRQLLSTSTSTTPASGTQGQVEVNGWIRSIRRQKNVSFAMVNDGSSATNLQAVFRPETSNDLTNGSCVRLLGQLCPSPGKGQANELRVESVEVLGACDAETYPIQKQELTVDYLRDQCHLRSRTDKVAAMLRIRDKLVKSIHTYFEGQAFQYVHAPIITSSDCEGGGETFAVLPSSTAPQIIPSTDNANAQAEQHFFGHPAYLTVSSQLHLEALASSLSRVYTLSPCFRAERSQTNRHLAEFWMLEAEWAFTRNLEDICGLVEDLCKSMLRTVVLKESGDEDLDVLWRAGRRTANGAEYVRRTYERQLQDPWDRISYTDAIQALTQHHESSSKNAFEYKPVWGSPLQSEHEKFVAERMFGRPVFITNYPAFIKPFYMRRDDNTSSLSSTDDDENTTTAACFDLIVPGVGELVGGSLREERLSKLDAALSFHGLDREGYEWYRDLRKFGGAPHGGFGMGFERLVSWITGVENVRECIPMPRWAGRMLL